MLRYILLVLCLASGAAQANDCALYERQTENSAALASGALAVFTDLTLLQATHAMSDDLKSEMSDISDELLTNLQRYTNTLKALQAAARRQCD